MSDLMMHILFHNDHQEHELECKEKIHCTTLVYTECMVYVFLMYIFKCMLCSN